MPHSVCAVLVRGVVEEAAKRARKALRLAKRLSRSWEPEKGVCVRCVEREVGQAPTFLAR